VPLQEFQEVNQIAHAQMDNMLMKTDLVTTVTTLVKHVVLTISVLLVTLLTKEHPMVQLLAHVMPNTMIPD
jgi:hypothetical protein